MAATPQEVMEFMRLQGVPGEDETANYVAADLAEEEVAPA
jgi:hypothetical protein